MNKNNKTKIAAGITIGIALAAIAGYYYGNKSKKTKYEQVKKPKTQK